MFNLILFGPPGSGKGTQSEKIIEKYGLVHLSTGDLLRSEIARQTVLGLEAKKLMDVGQLVPDEVVEGMISCALDDNTQAKGFLFDGFPRTAAQAQSLDQMLEFRRETIAVMLALDVSEDELIKRMIKRGETSGRIDDRNSEVMAARINVYRNETESVALHYRGYNKVIMIPGEGTIDEISQRLCKEIDSRL